MTISIKTRAYCDNYPPETRMPKGSEIAHWSQRSKLLQRYNFFMGPGKHMGTGDKSDLTNIQLQHYEQSTWISPRFSSAIIIQRSIAEG